MPRIMARQIAPQCLAPVAVVASVNLGSAIFAEAALSFLGVGVPPPTPSLGNMLGGVLAQSFQPPWWLVVFPGATIALTVLGANLLGDALRDYFDPRLTAQPRPLRATNTPTQARTTAEKQEGPVGRADLSPLTKVSRRSTTEPQA
jgi:hypothetical protein